MSVGQEYGVGNSGNSGSNPKVAIPRAPGPPASQRPEKRRITHACEPCRHRKTKCDGVRPTCGHCDRLLIQCKYKDNKRETQKKRMEELEARVSQYEQMLRNIRPVLDESHRAQIDAILTWNPETGGQRAETTEHSEQLQQQHQEQPQEPRSGSGSAMVESYANSDESDTSSLGSMDHLTEDINTLSINKPTGFMGRGSEVAWLKLLQNKLNISEDPADFQDFAGTLSGAGSAPADISATYHLDDIDLSFTGDQNQLNLDAYLAPPKPVADSLVRVFFVTLHPLVPIISRREFMEYYEAFYDTQTDHQLTNAQLAVINLVFAMGQRYYESFGGLIEWQHLTFFMRARVLSALDGEALFKVPTLFDVQLLGLMGLYLLCSKHTNRAWNVTGLALRLAYGQGLHIRNDDPSLTPYQREMRVRVWYSIVYLEATLALVTARPSGLQEQDSIGPVPRSSFMDGHGRPDMYYHAIMKMAEIAASVQGRLYSARTVNIRREQAVAEKAIGDLSARLDAWKSGLPQILSFDDNLTEDYYVRQRIDIAFRYHNVCLLIHFPCMMWTKRTSTNDSFARHGAMRCVESARSIIKIIMRFCDTQYPDTTACSLPWWCLLHYLVAAEAVLMLEIVLKASDCGEIDQASEELLTEARQPMAWLLRMSKTDLAAKRTYIQLSRLLQKVATAIGNPPDHAAPEYSTEQMFMDPIWLTPDMMLGLDPVGVHIYSHEMDTEPPAGYDHIADRNAMEDNPWVQGSGHMQSTHEGHT